MLSFLFYSQIPLFLVALTGNVWLGGLLAFVFNEFFYFWVWGTGGAYYPQEFHSFSALLGVMGAMAGFGLLYNHNFPRMLSDQYFARRYHLLKLMVVYAIFLSGFIFNEMDGTFTRPYGGVALIGTTIISLGALFYLFTTPDDTDNITGMSDPYYPSGVKVTARTPIEQAHVHRNNHILYLTLVLLVCGVVPYMIVDSVQKYDLGVTLMPFYVAIGITGGQMLLTCIGMPIWNRLVSGTYVKSAYKDNFTHSLMGHKV